MIEIRQIVNLETLNELTCVWSKKPRGDGDLHVTFKEGNRIVFGAYEDDEPVGTLSLVLKREDPEVANGEDRAELNAFQIGEPYRGKGIASLLINKAIDEARLLGLRHLTLGVEKSNKLAHQIYLHWGFREFKRIINDEGIEEIYLSIEL